MGGSGEFISVAASDAIVAGRSAPRCDVVS